MDEKPKREPLRFDIPPGTPVTNCRGCNAEIAFVKTPAGKSMPVNGDGTSHFGTCPQAKRFSRKKGK